MLPKSAKPGPDIGRVDVSEPASISFGIAERYATAMFEISKETKAVAKLEANINDLISALDQSADLQDLISSPVLSRNDQKNAILAIADRMKFIPVMRNGLGVMAKKRRLFIVPPLLDRLRSLIAEDKGEVTVEVTSPKALTDAQADNLVKTLKASVGKDVNIKATVDESLIGGLVVKVGSKMIDTSIAARLNSLQNAMKEVR